MCWRPSNQRLQKTEDTPAIYANCDGDHPANAVTCDSCKKRLKWFESKRNKTKLTFKNRNDKNETENFNFHKGEEFPKLRSTTVMRNKQMIRGNPMMQQVNNSSIKYCLVITFN